MQLLRGIKSRLSRETSSGLFVPEIDGLRFIAIAAVFLFHVSDYLTLKRGQLFVADPLSQGVAPLLKAGAFGVELFFAISGFILAIPFAAPYLEGAARVELKHYLLRRLTRIEPPYFINMVLIYALLVWINHESGTALFPHLLASLGYAHNVVYAEPSTINIVAWSLEIEVQFYILAPLLARVFAIPNLTYRRAVMTAAALTAMILQRVYPPSVPSLLGSIQYFLTGFLLADVYLCDWKRSPKQSWGWDAASMVAWLAIIFHRFAGKPAAGGFLPFAVFAAYCGAFRGRAANQVFRNAWLVLIGGMCYTIYLYHSLIISFVGRFAASINPGPMFWQHLLIQLLIMGPATLVACAAFFVVLEKPFMRRDWLTRSRAAFKKYLPFRARQSVPDPKNAMKLERGSTA